ncbi:MAG TPA: NAD(P)-dependent oxidoreductase [Gaiellaceae bacterium]|nr:NAD(P)-dependent oxidoreductase [Gaiellaceae bacterium]
MLRVGLSEDMRRSDGSTRYDVSLLAEAGIKWEFVPGHEPELFGLDALVALQPYVTARSLEHADRLCLVARVGVGLDRIDVASCTKRGVLVTTSPDGVRRPLAAGAMALVLALAHRLVERDRRVRSGWWERHELPGVGLRGRTLGVIGVGNVGRELCELAAPFELQLIAADPYADDPPAGVELVQLEELLRRSDFVVCLCPLTDETRGLLDARRLALLKPTAFLVNVARGAIVDQRALVEALRQRRFAGAALDVFEQEPIDPGDPLLQLENVILSPHAVALTDEAFIGSGRSACEAVLALARGEVPRHAANPEALEHPRLSDRLYAHTP